MSRFFPNVSRFLTSHLSELPMIKRIPFYFAAFVAFLLSFATPAHADPAVGPAFEWRSERYQVGSATLDTSGNRMAIDTAKICAGFADMEQLYGKGNVVIHFGGSSDTLRYDQLHDAHNGGLAVSRQSFIKNQFQSACPVADLDREDSWADENRPEGWRYSWVRIEPKDGVGRKPVMPDLPADPNLRWDFLRDPAMQQVNNLCPVRITADAYARTYTISYDRCSCTDYDVVPKSAGFQVYSESAFYDAAKDSVTEQETIKDLTWTQVRMVLEDNPRYAGEVDRDGNSITATPNPDGGGLSVEFSESESSMTVQFPNRCEAKTEVDVAAAEQEVRKNFLKSYRVNGVVMASPGLEASVLGDGSSLTTHPYGTFPAEIGVEVGGLSPVAFLGTLGVGGAYDDNCNMPAAWLVQGRVGLTINRQGLIGGLIDARVQYSFAPSYSITPDDPDTAENEYAASSALGTDAVAFLVDVGPRIAFSEYGVHSGWIAPTFTAGPKLRWFDDKSGQQRVTLTGDFGATLNVGWDF